MSDGRAGGGKLDPRGVSLRLHMPWLILVGAVSVTLTVLGAGRGDRLLPALAAALMAATVVASALRVNWRAGSGSEGTADGAGYAGVMACYVWLAAIVYAWGASTLLAAYSLSGLAWQHGWQYGLGAAIVAAGLSIYALRLERRGALPPGLRLTALHGLAAAGGLAYLIGADKLATLKSDWAANNVFLYGGAAIVLLCAITAATQLRDRRSAS